MKTTYTKNEKNPKNKDNHKNERDPKNDDKPNQYDKGCSGGAVRNMSSAVCASSIYSRHCLKLSSFLFERAWEMPRKLHLSFGIPFPVWMSGIISGLTSVVVWLSL